MINLEKTILWIHRISKFLFDPLILILSFWLLALLLNYHWDFALYPYQHGIREGATPSLIHLFDHDQPVFSYETLPVYFYSYGFVYPFLGYLFSIGSYLVSLRILTLLFAFFCSFLLSWTIYRTSGQAIWSLIFIPIFFWVVIIHSSGALPTTTGQFFYLACLIFPIVFKSRLSLILSAIFGLLAFHTKTYFVLAPAMVGLYLFLFRSKKTGLLYSSGFLGIFILSFPLVIYFFPAYYDSIYFTHIGTTYPSFPQHRFKQLEDFFFSNRYILQGFISIACIGTLIFLWKWIIKWGIKSLEISYSRKWIRDFKKPVIDFDKPAMAFSLFGLLAFLAFYFRLGLHTGAGQASYLNHISYPFFLLLLPIAMNSGIQFRLIIQLFIALQLSLLWIPSSPKKNFNYLENQMGEIENLILSKGEVLNSPSVASIIVNNNLPLYENGQSLYFRDCAVKGNPNRSKIDSINSEFVNRVREKIERKEFDLIMLKNDETYFGLDNSYLSESGYSLLQERNMPLTWFHIRTQFWVPIPDKTVGIASVD